MEYSRLTPCEEEWAELSEEYVQLQDLHKEYLERLEQVVKTRSKFEKALNHQKYRLSCLEASLKKIDSDKERRELLEKDIRRREAQLSSMAGSLPKSNGFYLSIILGSINVSILNSSDRFLYKEEYEKFKLIVTLVVLALALLGLAFRNTILDLLFMFLLVWYYCTLTIRESILRVNGSRIKGWWRAHHFIATVMSGVLLVWASAPSYQQFRTQFLVFNLYIGMVQYMQFVYQKGCLYRLKALGDRYSMDITIEGFHSWMWKGLTFLLPFLYIGYLFQLYNAYVLFHFSKEPDSPWPVGVLSFLFAVLFVGNTITTSMVIPQKMWARLKREMKFRFPREEKVSRSHRKNRCIPVDSSKDPGDGASCVADDEDRGDKKDN